MVRIFNPGAPRKARPSWREAKIKSVPYSSAILFLERRALRLNVLEALKPRSGNRLWPREKP
jgi:hypothetical protein